MSAVAVDRVPEARGPAGPGPRPRVSGFVDRRAPVVGAAILLVLLVVTWEVAWRAEWFNRSTFPPPRDVVTAAGQLLGEGAFWAAVRTVQEVVLVLVGALVLGTLIGCVFWKVPALGRAAEPLMVAFYAVPIVVYYPITIVTIGFGSTPIVVLGIIAATIPMALNTWIGLHSVRPIYARLAASLECRASRRSGACCSPPPAEAMCRRDGARRGAQFVAVCPQV